MPYCLKDGSADRSFFRSSTAFPTVCVPYGSREGKSAHLWVHSYLPLGDDFANVLRAVDCSPYRSFFRSSTSIIPGRFAYRIPQRMAPDCSFLHSSTAFTTVFAPYCRVDGSGLLILPLVNGFHDGLRAVLLSGWHRIAHTSTRQRLSRRFVRRIAQRMAADCSFFPSSTAFPTVCAPYCSADGSTLRILPLVNGFHNGLRAVLLSGWQRIAHSSARQRLSRRFARRITQRTARRMALLLGSGFTHFFRLSMTLLTFYAP